jgi:DNA-binding beta-propeller fold protein YncE
MIKREIQAITAIVLFLLVAPVSLHAEWKGLFVSWLEDKCIKGTIHTLTYYSVLGGAFPFVVFDVDTGKTCCNQGTQSNARMGLQPKDAYACSPSTPQDQGGTETNRGTAASVTNLDAGSPPAGGSPTPSALSQARLSSLRPLGATGGVIAAPHLATSSGRTAYVPTVPFRPFALPPYYFGSSAPTQVRPQCNAQLNPTAYQVNHNVATVSRLNLCTGAVMNTVNVTTNPLEIAVTPDGKWAIVTSFYNAVSFIDTDNDTVANVIQTDANTFPFGIAISPDGSYALITNFNNQEDALVVVDVASQSITGTITLHTAYPQSVIINPDGTLAWVTFPFSNLVEVVDIMTGIEVTSISVPEPLDVAFNATGTTAYIASGQPGSVMAVSTSTYAVLATIPTAAGANDLLLSPDGGFLTTNNYFDGSISVIDATALTNVLTKPIGSAPFGVALMPIQ